MVAVTAEITAVTGETINLNLDVTLGGDNINLLTVWNIGDDTYGCRYFDCLPFV